MLRHNKIGYYPTAEQITIPHYDMNGRFVGLRGRALSDEDAEIYGKYRPLVVGKQMYNHPLGLNLYNLNNSIENIKKIRKAIIFEGEKSCLLYQSYFGISSDISVACCGSSISSVQMALLLNTGAEEIVIAFDKQFKEWGSYYGSFLRLPEECFPELTFEVSPQEVELTLCNYIDTVKIQDHNPKKQTCVMTNHGLVTDVVFK